MKKLLTIVLLMTTSLAFAYEYQIEKPVLESVSTPGHESITSLALDCLHQSGLSGQKPTNCLQGKDIIGAYKSDHSFVVPTISPQKITAEELMNVSSWPDDPTRLGGNIGAIINLFQACNDFWSFLGFKNPYETISGGLACNSHFGLLQFFHAQASSTDEPYLSTKNKVLAWVKFNYSIVRNASLLSEPYCRYFDNLKKDSGAYEMASAFLPVDHQDLEQCQNNYTLNWIYNSSCKTLASDKCESVEDTRNAQITALGAIIHVIQDSYSQSHNQRGNCTDNENKQPVSKISCLPIEQYYTYNAQDAGKHNDSDVLPIKIDASCQTATDAKLAIDDAVTATARVLWYASQEQETAELMAYLNRAVFTDPYIYADAAKQSRPESAAGMCYLPNTADSNVNSQVDFQQRLMGQ